VVRTLILCLLFVASFGCGSESPATNAALVSEVDVLKETLDAWKAGGKPASFEDPDWKSGAKLTEYRVVKAGAEDAGETICTVVLKLQQAGKSVERTVSYRVIQSPRRAVTRYAGK
jgi:hypothetical protein